MIRISSDRADEWVLQWQFSWRSHGTLDWFSRRCLAYGARSVLGGTTVACITHFQSERDRRMTVLTMEARSFWHEQEEVEGCSEKIRA